MNSTKTIKLQRRIPSLEEVSAQLALYFSSEYPELNCDECCAKCTNLSCEDYWKMTLDSKNTFKQRMEMADRIEKKLKFQVFERR